MAAYELGDKATAQGAFERSAKLLATAPAAYFLGTIARDRGDTTAAMQYFKTATGSDSSYGKEATAEYVRLDLPQHPGNYVAAGLQADANGRVYVVIENRAPMPLAAIVVTPVLVDAGGRILQHGAAVQFRGPVPSGQRASSAIDTTHLTAEQLRYVRVRVDAARPAP